MSKKLTIIPEVSSIKVNRKLGLSKNNPDEKNTHIYTLFSRYVYYLLSI